MGIPTAVSSGSGGVTSMMERDRIPLSPRTLESLCQELVEQGLLIQPSTVRMQDYFGEI